MGLFSWNRRTSLICSSVALAVLGGGLATSAPSALADGPCGTNGVFSASNSTCTYTTAGEDTFAVPSGVSAVSVMAIGAPGGPGADDCGSGGSGGLGATVDATVSSLTPSSTLYVHVGAAGQPGSGDDGPGGAGGSADGGNGGSSSSPPCAGVGGGGGGSSDLSTEPRSSDGLTGTPGTDPRLVVAGGGGGGGGGGDGSGGGGGSAGVATSGAGAGGSNCGGDGVVGGDGGVGSGGGGAGSGCPSGGDGSASQAGSGGDGSDTGAAGGGGGGGFIGGGGGGGLASSTGGGDGGGAGSSFGPSGTSYATASLSDVPEVVISFSGASGTSLHASAPANGTAGTAIAPGSIGANLSGGNAPSGTITFIVFGPQPTSPTNCTSGGTTIGNPRGASGDGIYRPSTGFTPPAAGDYWWYARYSGDSNNSPAASPCGGAMPETVVAPITGGGGGGTQPPSTPQVSNFKIHPKHHKASFTFTASVASGFVCALVRVHKHHKHKHKANYSSCSSPVVYKHLKAGKYIFKVKSVGPNGAETIATTQSFTI